MRSVENWETLEDEIKRVEANKEKLQNMVVNYSNASAETQSIID